VFGDWGFTKHRGEAMNEMWEKIPNNIDILVTHGPPLGRPNLFSTFSLIPLYLLALISGHTV
jgi:hypothetical protein